MSCDYEIGVVNEDSTFSIMARVHADGANVTQSDVGSISYAIYYADDLEEHTASSSLTVSAVIFDTLQTDDRWTTDNTGYNFRHDVGHTVLTDPTRRYRFEYKFTLSGGSEFYLNPIEVTVRAVKTS